MKKTEIGKGVLVVVLAALVGVAPVLPRRTYATSWFTGATELTQLANMAQLIDQTLRAIEQVRTIKTQLEIFINNMKNFGDGNGWDFLVTSLTDTRNILTAIQGSGYAGESLIKKFEAMHPGHIIGDGAATLRRLREQNMQSVRAAVQTLGLQDKASLTAYDVMQELRRKGETAEGQRQAMEVTNRLLAAMLEQLILMHATLRDSHRQMLLVQGMQQQEASYRSEEVKARKETQNIVRASNVEWSSRIGQAAEQKARSSVRTSTNVPAGGVLGGR